MESQINLLLVVVAVLQALGTMLGVVLWWLLRRSYEDTQKLLVKAATFEQALTFIKEQQANFEQQIHELWSAIEKLRSAPSG